MVDNIINETDTEGTTKILTMLKVKLPHRDRLDNMKLNVDNVTESNILPLRSFRSMFPHELDEQGQPVPRFLKNSRTKLEC